MRVPLATSCDTDILQAKERQRPSPRYLPIAESRMSEFAIKTAILVLITAVIVLPMFGIHLWRLQDQANRIAIMRSHEIKAKDEQLLRAEEARKRKNDEDASAALAETDRRTQKEERQHIEQEVLREKQENERWWQAILERTEKEKQVADQKEVSQPNGCADVDIRRDDDVRRLGNLSKAEYLQAQRALAIVKMRGQSGFERVPADVKRRAALIEPDLIADMQRILGEQRSVRKH